MKYVIEKNAPPPPGRERKYPRWRDMEIGDCVFIPRENSASSGPSSARMAGKRYGMKFTVKSVTDGPDGQWGIRIWRIA